jgi:hypothetical protein
VDLLGLLGFCTLFIIRYSKQYNILETDPVSEALSSFRYWATGKSKHQVIPYVKHHCHNTLESTCIYAGASNHKKKCCTLMAAMPLVNVNTISITTTEYFQVIVLCWFPCGQLYEVSRSCQFCKVCNFDRFIINGHITFSTLPFDRQYIYINRITQFLNMKFKGFIDCFKHICMASSTV